MKILWESTDSTRGGSISFSLEVNASARLSSNPVLRWFCGKWLTLQKPLSTSPPPPSSLR